MTSLYPRLYLQHGAPEALSCENNAHELIWTGDTICTLVIDILYLPSGYVKIAIERRPFMVDLCWFTKHVEVS